MKLDINEIYHQYIVKVVIFSVFLYRRQIRQPNVFKLSDKLMEVREVFIDFEDMGIVSYTVVVSGYENGGYYSFDPKRGDFERFLDYITPTLSLGLTKDANLGGPGLDQKYKLLGRKTGINQ